MTSRSPVVLWMAGAAALHHGVVGAILGPGDAEALYLVYARHWQGGYLDHPPLVAQVIRVTAWLAGDVLRGARLGAALAFALAILIMDALVRAMGASARAGSVAAGALLAVPMFAAGSLAMTPDAVLAPLALAFLLASVRAMERPGHPGHAALAGLLLGLAFLAKYSALLLVPGLLAAALRGHHAPRGRRIAGLAIAGVTALVVASPVIAWNAAQGWPSLMHRLVWTQREAGASWRNLGALLGGQLAYVGPPLLLAFVATLRKVPAPAIDGWRRPALGALVGVVALGLWSRVAEPHWTAIAYLPLIAGLGLGSDDPGLYSRRLARATIAWAVVVLAVLHLYVLTPLAPRFLPPWAYEPRFDIANELHGWPAVARAIRSLRRPGEVVAAGHYTMCAQLEVALGADVRCLTRETDDWDLWGRGARPSGRSMLFVTDTRYPDPPAGARRIREVQVHRGGRQVRAFVVWRV